MLMRLKAEMYCPKCGSDSVVYDTVSNKTTIGHLIKRRRQCKNCKERFTTYEILSSEYKALLEGRYKAQEISKTIAKVMELAERYNGEDYDT